MELASGSFLIFEEVLYILIFYSLSFLCKASHNKDSSALLLLMLEKDMPIDCVLYADTGMEFPEMEAHIANKA